MYAARSLFLIVCDVHVFGEESVSIVGQFHASLEGSCFYLDSRVYAACPQRRRVPRPQSPVVGRLEARHPEAVKDPPGKFFT